MGRELGRRRTGRRRPVHGGRARGVRRRPDTRRRRGGRGRGRSAAGDAPPAVLARHPFGGDDDPRRAGRAHAGARWLCAVHRPYERRRGPAGGQRCARGRSGRRSTPSRCRCRRSCPRRRAQDKLVVFVPRRPSAPPSSTPCSAAGAGRIGDYERCAWWTTGTGTFRPLTGADPTIGAVGRDRGGQRGSPRARSSRGLVRSAVIAALRSAHSYEEPAFDVVPVATAEPGARARGLGRIGRLAEPIDS